MVERTEYRLGMLGERFDSDRAVDIQSRLVQVDNSGTDTLKFQFQEIQDWALLVEDCWDKLETERAEIGLGMEVVGLGMVLLMC
jgi:hypothetical protein